MRFRKLGNLTLFLLLTACASSSLAGAQTDPTAKQDMKNAGSNTKTATKSAGSGISKGTKKAYSKTKHGTKKAYHKVDGDPTTK